MRRAKYYNQATHEVLDQFATTERGLSASEASRRLARYGKNILKERKKVSPVKILVEQFNAPVVWILVAALIIAFVIGERIDAIVIAAILIVNAIIGFFQEYRAERDIEALKRLGSHKALVIRDGKEREIDASEVVPGDILSVREGDKVAADARIIRAVQTETQESILTGESLPVTKTSEQLPGEQDVAEQRNMLFSGTEITRGKARAVVVRTGMHSEIGKIAKLIQEAEKQRTPLQEKLARLGGMLSIITVIICALVFLAGLLAGEKPLDIFTISVALAVAAIPEGLPAVVTIGLAVGVRRMLRRNALIRKLPSVETLGSATVICSDKTGTLTHNQMTVKKLFANEKVIEVTGSGYDSRGEFSEDPAGFRLLLEIGALCSDARIENKQCIGDPTEGALIVSAQKAGISPENLNEASPRLNEIPFSSERKRMTTMHRIGDRYVAYMKGAPDIILNLCNSCYSREETGPLTKEMRQQVLNRNLAFAAEALRVIGFAFKEISDPQAFDESDERDFVFVGLQAMIDPPREEVKAAIGQCHEAGIKVVMVTGDHEGTAVAIANQIGIAGKCLKGKELEGLSDTDLRDVVEEISIYARVNPGHKQKIVRALQSKGHVVAVTGDGVNDAPALKRADIGIAMGMTGTDVSREASDMVLTDDNFKSIVSAIEEGRGVFDNIKKFFVLLLSGNIAEVAIIFILIMLGFPAPLTATQILLINLVTDGLPATALSVDPFEPGAMKRKPRKRNEGIQKGLSNYLVGSPLLMTAVAVTLFLFEFNHTENIEKARTFAFLTIVFFELYQAFASRSTIFPSLQIGLFKNKALVGATAISFIVAGAAVYVPAMTRMFGTAPLTAVELVSVLLVSSLGFIYLEISKKARGSTLD